MKRFLLFTIMSIWLHSKAQMLIEPKKADQIKNGITYVLMKDPKDPKSLDFQKAVKEGWTFTKGVEFIPYEDMIKYPDPANSFIKLSVYNSIQRMAVAVGGQTISGRMYTAVEVFQCDKKYFKRGGDLWVSDVEAIATLFFFADNSSILSPISGGPEKLKESNFLISDKVFNLYPGYLKNQLQQATLYLKNKESVNIRNRFKNKEKLAILKNATLYVPEFNAMDLKPFTVDPRKKNLDKVMQDYDYKYQIIDNQKLSNKVLNGEDIYYLVTTYGDRGLGLLSVIHAKTGEYIYTEMRASSIAPTEGDMKELSRSIK